MVWPHLQGGDAFVPRHAGEPFPHPGERKCAGSIGPDEPTPLDDDEAATAECFDHAVPAVVLDGDK